MNTRKHQSIKMFFLVLCVAIIATAPPVIGKSLYVLANIASNPSPLNAYDIQSTPGYLVYQATYGVPNWASGAVGLAIDTDSEMLFITYENGNIIQLVNAKTMTDEGNVTAPGASDLAGIVVDQDKQKVYTIDRNTDNLYVYSWDATTKILTLDVQRDLTGVTSGVGLALDEVHDLLYVGDMVATNNIDVFSTDDWSWSASYTVNDVVLGIAVDVKNGYVYTGSAGWYGKRLCKYDMNTDIATFVGVFALTGSTDDGAVGLAVDPISSLLYVTTGNQGSVGRLYNDTDCILVLDSDFNVIFRTADIGNPTGICIPGKDVSFNPLNLAKNDVVQGVGVPIGQNFTYEMTTENTNAYDVTGVTLVDHMPVELDFITEYVNGVEGSGVYDATAHTVTWALGTIPAGAEGPLVELVVVINDQATEGTTIYNTATVESSETPPTTVIGDDPNDTTGAPGTIILPSTSNGSIFGQVSLSGGGGVPGVPVNLIANNVTTGQVLTDGLGKYEFPDLMNGDYVVELQVPLGMTTEGESVVPVTVAAQPMEVNFVLTNAASGKVMDIWTWKLHLKAIKDGKKLYGGLTPDDFNRYGELLFEHFYGRPDGFAIQIPGVTYAYGPRALTYDDLYAIMFNGIDTYKAKAERTMLANLLNVVSSRQGQLTAVTVDGATASQAITYFAGLYNAGGTADYYAVYVNLQKMHMKVLMAAGIVPLGTPNILFKPGEILLPENFSLSQNYPNPFNPTTTIAFSLPVASAYSLTIYNTVGQVVDEIRGHASAGMTTLPWDGSVHSSGVYLYRLTAGSFMASKKMILLK